VSNDAGQHRTSDLVPRMIAQGYTSEDVVFRRNWIADKTGVELPHITNCSIPTDSMRGNIENPIGSVQVPLGVAGPLRVNGQHAQGTFYVPLATTEGALVRSYERGMVLLTRAGGASVRIYQDENRIAPVFVFESVSAAHDFAHHVMDNFDEIKNQAESTTAHGKLLRVECYPVGREVQLNFCFFTADAQGMNMIMKAANKACEWILEHSCATDYFIFSGLNSEKRASGFLLAGGKGKKVVAGALLPAKLVRMYLHATPAQLLETWHHTILGHVNANAVGYNGHFANGLTALFIACGQDVANVANSSVGITNFEVTTEGDLYASVTLPSLSVATVGGGTGLGSSQECLAMLGCFGSGKALKFAEITAATLLAGELSMGAAIASGEFVAAHESYGRNPPQTAPSAQTL
jgi:hydroxymethylglutaryl-CoA reductase (NADPH)